MSSPTPALDDLRRRLDEIDDAIHDLLMRRTAVVQEVASLKEDGRPAMRPDREAEILRRLVARHRGPFPVPVLVRLWREMLSAFTSLQQPFGVAVHAPEDGAGLWDIARDHFGSATPMAAFDTPTPTLRAVMEGRADIAVLRWPEDDDPEPWWPALMSGEPRTPRVIACLPFLADQADNGIAAVVAQMVPAPTGDDRSLIGIELSGDLSRGRLKAALEAAGLQPVGFRSGYPPGPDGAARHLVEVDGHVAAGDGRIAALVEGLGPAADRVTPIGGFAMPLPAGTAASRG